MNNETELYNRACEAIDSLNREDPTSVEFEGKQWPTEYLYSLRMSDELNLFMPHASVTLKIAARAQHIARWRSPRSNYEMNRAGYLKWRSELYVLHAQYAGEQLEKAGFDQEFIEAVQQPIRDKVKRNSPDAQAVEDVACLVFLRYYFADFVQKHSGDKLNAIILKTWNKMSDAAHEQALKIPFEPDHLELIKAALA